MSNSELKVLAVLLALAGVAVAVWYFQDQIILEEPAPVVASPAPEAVEEQTPELSVPQHPVEPVAAPETGETEPLPPLDESDVPLSNALRDALGPGLADLLINEALVDRLVATVDNLPRQHVPEKIRPVGRLASPFVVAGSDDDRYFVLGPENYQRYAAIVTVFTEVDIDAALEMYRRYYPLFQESYERLGYPGAYFNDRMVEVIDHLLQTPESPQALQLVRPHVLYEFADAEIEALSSGQKLMLRIGPEQAGRVKTRLRALRARLVNHAAEGRSAEN